MNGREHRGRAQVKNGDTTQGMETGGGKDV